MPTPQRLTRWIRRSTVVALVALASPAFAQTPAPVVPPAPAPAATTPDPQTPSPSQGATTQASTQAATAPAPQAQHDMQMPPTGDFYPNFKMVGFGDIDYTQTKHPEGPRGFSEGQFVLHMTSALSPRVTFFGELSFTARADAGTGSPPATGFNAEVERMILRFDKNDQFKVSFGRYHTPINYWNTAFHHGQWLQTTISRPEMIQFGGKFLPVHFVGALVEGAVPAGGWNLNYKAGVGNGRGSVISRAGDAGDINGNRAFLFNAFSKPDKLYGLEFGGSYYNDLLTIPTSVPNIHEGIISAHVAWSREDPEFIAEYAGVRHEVDGASSPTWNQAFYVQAAYRLPQFNRLWKPYFRFEHIGINQTDIVFTTVPQLDGLTLGTRFDASQLAALKFEFRTWTRGPGSLRNYGGFFQICFTF